MSKNSERGEETILTRPAPDDSLDDAGNMDRATGVERGDWIFQASRKDLAACLDRAPCGIVVHRTWRGKVLYINRAAFDLSGYDIHETLTGVMAGRLFAPDLKDRRILRRRIREAALSKDKSTVFNVVCKGDVVKTVEVRVAMLSERMMVSMWTDVTRREQAELALRESKAELEDRVNKRTSELVSLNTRLREEVKTRRSAERELERSREELRNLSEHLQQARELERTRIARELHDDLSQALSAAKIDVARLGGALPEGSLRKEAAAIEGQLSGMIDATRNICTELRPPGFGPSGLPAAIEWHVAKYEKRTGIRCAVRIGSGMRLKGQGLALVVFRVLQEALANVARHAGATTVYIGLMQNRKNLVLTVRDNGKGMSREDILKPGSYGIMGMSERIRFWRGKLRFTFAPGKGTTVTVSIPTDQVGDYTD
jgi:PAS domain S-box-containing protein